MELVEGAARRPRTRGAALSEIEDVYAREAARLRRVAAGIVHDSDVVQDVVQETFARAVGKRASFSGVGALDAWVWRACVNTALNRRRRAQTETRAFPAPPGGSSGPPEHADDRVRAAVAALPDRQRAALFLHYYADFDYEAIGRVLRIRTAPSASCSTTPAPR